MGNSLSGLTLEISVYNLRRYFSRDREDFPVLPLELTGRGLIGYAFTSGGEPASPVIVADELLDMLALFRRKGIGGIT